jgi:serine/threonine-protein kinase
MYELLAGKLPFTGENAVEIALKHLREKIPCITKEVDNIPQSIENIILKACAKNPKNRYNNSREMYLDLKQALDDEHKDDSRLVYIHPEEDLDNTKTLNKIELDDDKPEIKKIEDKEPKTKPLFIILSLVTFLLALVFIFFFVLPKYIESKDVIVPDVSNMTVPEAEALLKSKGFEVAVETQKINSDTIAIEKVVKTSPAIGRTIKEGTLITIYESLGSKKVVIEDYTGENIYEVKARLELLGLVVDIESQNVEDVTIYKNREDEIIDQTPKEGNLIIGSQVILYYPNVVVYPDMTGWVLEDAQDFAEQYELNLTILESEEDSVTSGTVIDQNRKEGVLVVRKADFIITVAIPVSEVEE